MNDAFKITLEELNSIQRSLRDGLREGYREMRVPVSRVSACVDLPASTDSLTILDFYAVVEQDGWRWKCRRPLEVIL